MTLIKTCPFCGQTVEIFDVDPDAYRSWESGEKLIQEAFPDADPSVREAIKTGMCLDCQAQIFGVGDEEPEDLSEDADSSWEDFDLEEGFDPYMGCYTDDC